MGLPMVFCLCSADEISLWGLLWSVYGCQWPAYGLAMGSGYEICLLCQPMVLDVIPAYELA